MRLSYLSLFFAYIAVWISPAHSLGESLSLDYQNIYPSRGQDEVELGLRYDGACSHFVVEMFTRQNIIDGGNSVLEGHNSTVESSSVNISLEVFNQTQPVFVRIMAASEDGNICSDDRSQQLYYHFGAPGREEILEYESSVEVPIPTTHCYHPVVVWPRTSTSNGDHCYCLSLRNSVYSFEGCVEACQTHHNVTFNGSSIFFHDLNMTNDSFLVHFVCDEAPCSQTSCILETVVASYRISLGTNFQTAVTPTQPQPLTCREAGHTSGCCKGGQSECYVFRRRCYCDVTCFMNNNCCSDIETIGCFPSNCAEAGKLNCNISRIDPVELCDVQMPNNMYCYCNEMCTEDCCPDSVTVSTAGLNPTLGEISYNLVAAAVVPAVISTMVILIAIIIGIFFFLYKVNNLKKKKIYPK